MSEAEQKHSSELAERLSMPLLARAWQMLLKGIEETKMAPRPMAAAEMVVIRMAHSADLPPPEDLIRILSQGQTAKEARQPAPAPPGSTVQKAGAAGDRRDHTITDSQARPAAEPFPDSCPVYFEDFEAVVAYVGGKRDAKLKFALEEHARLIRFAQGHIELQHRQDTPKTLANELGQKLTEWTGERWIVSFSSKQGQATFAERRAENFAKDLQTVKSHPLVQDLLAHFPDAEITKIRKAEKELPEDLCTDPGDDE